MLNRRRSNLIVTMLVFGCFGCKLLITIPSFFICQPGCPLLIDIVYVERLFIPAIEPVDCCATHLMGKPVIPARTFSAGFAHVGRHAASSDSCGIYDRSTKRLWISRSVS